MAFDNQLSLKSTSSASDKRSTQNDRRQNLKNMISERSSEQVPFGDVYPALDLYSVSPFRWERQKTFLKVVTAKERLERSEDFIVKRVPGRVLLDTFASSLLHVSRIYNRAFNYMARKVPAHMPHMVDINMIKEMQQKFWQHFDRTSSHKIRSPNDMQFAFSYFYYLMGVPAAVNTSRVFTELDTDASGKNLLPTEYLTQFVFFIFRSYLHYIPL